MNYTEEQRAGARRELARRELERRKQQSTQSLENEIPYTPNQPTQGYGGVMEDVEGIPGKALDYFAGLGGRLPQEAGEAANQYAEHPFKTPARIEGNILSQLLEGGKELYNAPLNANTYLASKHLPYLDWLFKRTAPIAEKLKIGNTGLEQMIMGEPQKGDKFWKDATDIATMISGGKAIIKSIPGVKNIPQRINAIKQHGPLSKSIEELETKHGEISSQHEQNTQNLNALKEHLESLPGFQSSKPSVLRRKAEEANKELVKLRGQSESTPEHLRATEEPMVPEKTPLSLVEPVRPALKNVAEIKKPEISEENINRSENLLKSHEQKSAELEKQFGEGYLRKGYTHDVPISEKVSEAIEGIKNPKTGKFEGGRKQEIGKIYDTVQHELEDKHVLIPNEQKLIDTEKEIRELMEKSRGHFKNDEEFESTVKRLANNEVKEKGPSHDIVPAADVLKNFRTMRHLSQKLRKEAFSTKVASNKDLQSEILSKAEDFDTHAQNLEKMLENHDLGPSLGKLKSANQRWREEIVPLYRNTTYQKFLKGIGPDNIMKSLRGKGPGQEIIRDIIKKDPELLRNIVGQRYANNPAKLHEFDELTHEYTQHMPEVQKFRNEHFASKQNEAKARMDMEAARHEHQLQKEKADLAHKQQIENVRAENAKAKEQAAEQTRLKKAEVDRENKSRQKEHEAKSEHYKIHQQIKALEGQYEKLMEHARLINEKSNKKNISLKEKIEIEANKSKIKEQLAKIQKDIKLRNRILKGIGITIASGLLGGPVYNTIASKVGIK